MNPGGIVLKFPVSKFVTHLLFYRSKLTCLQYSWTLCFSVASVRETMFKILILNIGDIICGLNVALMFDLINYCNGRYMFGLSATNAGLLMLLDKGPSTRQWRCLMSTQVWNHQSKFLNPFESQCSNCQHPVALLPWFAMLFSWIPCFCKIQCFVQCFLISSYVGLNIFFLDD